MIYFITILHTMGSETITIEADSLDDALVIGREWALREGMVLLRCTVIAP